MRVEEEEKEWDMFNIITGSEGLTGSKRFA